MAESDFRWTQDSWDSSPEVGERRVAGRNERLAWFAVIGLAVVAFEVTADPALTVSLGCLKFGWDEFRLAGWLKRTDPNRRRGKICSRFYLAWGLWRISIVAIAMASLIVYAHAAIDWKPGNGLPPGFVSAILLSLSGFVLSSLVSSLAVISALRHRVKVWLGPEARWAREENAWPPHAVTRRRPTSNRTKAIVLSAIITLVMIAILILVIPLSNALPQRKVEPPLSFIVFMTFFLGVPFLILLLLEWLGNWMIAATPEECWADRQEHPGNRIVEERGQDAAV